MLAWIYCSLSAVSVDEGMSARSVDQSLNSTGVQEVIGYRSLLWLVYEYSAAYNLIPRLLVLIAWAR